LDGFRKCWPAYIVAAGDGVIPTTFLDRPGTIASLFYPLLFMQLKFGEQIDIISAPLWTPSQTEILVSN
jgi:hypothetical protein